MKNLLYPLLMLLCIAALHPIQAEGVQYEVVTASNDANNNQLLVYDASGKLLQSIPTNGQGGVPPHSVGGGIAKSGSLLAVINYNSQSVTLFKQQGNSFKLLQVLPVLSKPVSLAFGYNHLYVLGTTTVESHAITGESLAERPDGSTRLYVADGSAAQVGVVTNQLIISERSNMIETVELRDGIVTNNMTPVKLPANANNTPVGLATRRDSAYVTIAHSDKVGLIKNDDLIALVSSGDQHAPCWLTLQGSWLYCSNTPSKTISRYQVTENSITLIDAVEAKTRGEPTDIDSEEGIVAALELKNNAVFLSQFQADPNGRLKLLNSFPTSKTANGIAVIPLK